MSVPATPPQFFPPPYPSGSEGPQFFPPSYPFGSEGLGFWPQVPIDNEQLIPVSNAEFPPFKKPRNAEEIPPNSFPNTIQNSRMPPPNPPVQRGIGRIFFKTRLCARFKAGTCPYGLNCNFAHGIEDVRKPPPNWQEIVASQGDERMTNWENDQRLITRLKLCKKFYNGEECPYGERCNFLHEDPAKFRESSVVTIGNTDSSLDNMNGSDQPDGNGFMNFSGDYNMGNQKPVYWKTRMCNKWETTGHCPFAEKCHFAHGQAELQKFGSHTEVEMGNVIAIPSRSLSIPARDTSPIKAEIGASCKQQVLGKRNLLKWKGPEKISRIYADWIDDIPLVQSSPSKDTQLVGSPNNDMWDPQKY